MPAALDVARYFLSLVNEDEGELMSNLKLQKLLYYAQGAHLGLNDRKLFDEPVEAWGLGPVVPKVYDHFKDHGGDAIHHDPDAFDPNTIDEETKELLDEVYQVYGQYSASALVRLTHDEAPWKKTDTREEIDPNLMRDYFKNYLLY